MQFRFKMSSTFPRVKLNRRERGKKKGRARERWRETYNSVALCKLKFCSSRPSSGSSSIPHPLPKSPLLCHLYSVIQGKTSHSCDCLLCGPNCFANCDRSSQCHCSPITSVKLTRWSVININIGKGSGNNNWQQPFHITIKITQNNNTKILSLCPA